MLTLSSDQKKIYQEATALWGVEFLRGMIHEEYGEYLVAENHYFNRNRCTEDDLVEEVADVMVTMFQLALLLGETEVLEVMQRKIVRLGERVAQANPQWKEG